MSFVRYLALGYFDPNAARQGELILRRPMEPEALQRAAEGIGQFANDDVIVNGRSLFRLYNGYVMGPSPVMRQDALDFIERLHRETGCDILDPDFGVFYTPEELRIRRNALLDPKNQGPSLAELERVHRELVEKSKAKQRSEA